jgi:hypothetical protein
MKDNLTIEKYKMNLLDSKLLPQLLVILPLGVNYNLLEVFLYSIYNFQSFYF